MAPKREKRFYFKTVATDPSCPWVDIGYNGPNKRGQGLRGAPMVIKHSKRLYPSRGEDRFGRPLPADYIVTDRPIAQHYLEDSEKMVSRPTFGPHSSLLPERRMVKKQTFQKFEEVDEMEVIQAPPDKVHTLPWTEDLFTEPPKQIKRPDLKNDLTPPMATVTTEAGE